MFNKLKKNQCYDKKGNKTESNERKYLFLNASDIERCTYKVKRELAYNDYDNVYYQTGYETIESIFDENGIPKEYQKVIIEFDSNLMGYFVSNTVVMELLTKNEFFLKTISYNDMDGGYISGFTKCNQLPDAMYFRTDSDFFNYDKVLNFLRTLNSLNLMDSYARSILLFFRKISEEKKNDVALSMHI